jgi:hypothetical protein
MLNVIQIEVPNWNKFNPRTDRANHTWFRMQADFLTDPHVFGLSDAEKLLLLMIYSACCKVSTGSVKFNMALSAALRKTTVEEIQKQIQSLQDAGLIRCHEVGDQPSLFPLQTDETNGTKRTNETNETNERSAPAEERTPGALSWDAYSLAYEGRYGHAPPRNKKINGMLKQFSERIPVEEAPKVADFYLKLREPKYLASMHSVGCLLQDAEKIWTQWKTGHRVNSQQAKQHERADANREATRAAIQEMGAKARGAG